MKKDVCERPDNRRPSRVRPGGREYLVGDSISYADPDRGAADRESERVSLIIGVIKSLDMLLIGTLLLIFAFGLYELFLKEIELPATSGSTSRRCAPGSSVRRLTPVAARQTS